MYQKTSWFDQYAWAIVELEYHILLITCPTFTLLFCESYEFFEFHIEVRSSVEGAPFNNLTLHFEQVLLSQAIINPKHGHKSC